MKRFFRPLVLLLLTGMVALSPLCGLAQEAAADAAEKDGSDAEPKE